MITGAVGRAALKDHALGEGSIMGYSAFVTLSVLCGITSFILLFASAQLFRQRFLPEMMLVYSIRNLTMLILFTGLKILLNECETTQAFLRPSSGFDTKNYLFLKAYYT